MPKTNHRKMNAAVLERFGGVDLLKQQNVPVPDIAPDEVLIHLESSGVGVWDVFEREGGFHELGLASGKPKFPYVLGSDGAGTVEAVGKNVRGFQKGDRVYAFSLLNPKGGTYAEYAAVKAEHTSPIPSNLPVEQAGAMPVDAMTALRGLDDALHLKQGETVLIFGGGGGIGHLAVQLAKRMGARVFAVASGPDGVELAQRLGADAAVDGRRDDIESAVRAFAPEGVDAALITAGGDAAAKAIATVRDGGRVAYPNGVMPEPKARDGVSMTSYDGVPDASAIEKLNRLIESGPFEVHVAATFPLDRAADAHRALDKHYLGKLALRPH